MKIPSLDLKRVFELMEIEKTRPLTDEEIKSCVSQKKIPKKAYEKIIEHIMNNQEEYQKELSEDEKESS